MEPTNHMTDDKRPDQATLVNRDHEIAPEGTVITVRPTWWRRLVVWMRGTTNA